MSLNEMMNNEQSYQRH